MQGLPPSLIDQLDLKKAAEAEYSSIRNLVPHEPDWARIKKYSDILAEQTKSLLNRGWPFPSSSTVLARKSVYGYRPVPLLAPSSRVALRALTEKTLQDFPRLAREPQDWIAFSKAPAQYGESLSPKRKIKLRNITIFDAGPFNSPIKYVVKADVTAFYRYVDHTLLRRELLSQGANYHFVDPLIQLLGDLEGRPMGLPQLLDSSDRLSEIYIDSAERALIRRGFPTWRFNDDFRIACRNYSEALQALETLENSLHTLGLTLNDSKTTTPRFINYYMDVFHLEVNKRNELVSKQDVEDVVGDYMDDFSQDADSAAAFLSRLKESSVGDNDINLRTLTSSRIRLIKRAFNGLAAHNDARGLKHALPTVRYAGSLTPVVTKYITAIAKARKAPLTQTMGALDEMTSRAATNDWQDLWIIQA